MMASRTSSGRRIGFGAGGGSSDASWKDSSEEVTLAVASSSLSSRTYIGPGEVSQISLPLDLVGNQSIGRRRRTTCGNLGVIWKHLAQLARHCLPRATVQEQRHLERSSCTGRESARSKSPESNFGARRERWGAWGASQAMQAAQEGTQGVAELEVADLGCRLSAAPASHARTGSRKRLSGKGAGRTRSTNQDFPYGPTFSW